MHGVELPVEGALLHEFVMFARGFDTAPVDDDDPVGMKDGGEPVSYDKCGPVLDHIVYGVLHILFRLGIQR